MNNKAEGTSVLRNNKAEGAEEHRYLGITKQRDIGT